MKKHKSQQDSMQRMVIAQVADILATGVMRLHLRYVRKLLKKNKKTETGLEVLPPKSLHRLEPKQRGEKR